MLLLPFQADSLELGLGKMANQVPRMVEHVYGLFKLKSYVELSSRLTSRSLFQWIFTLRISRGLCEAIEKDASIHAMYTQKVCLTSE